MPDNPADPGGALRSCVGEGNSRTSTSPMCLTFYLDKKSCSFILKNRHLIFRAKREQFCLAGVHVSDSRLPGIQPLTASCTECLHVVRSDYHRTVTPMGIRHLCRWSCAFSPVIPNQEIAEYTGHQQEELDNFKGLEPVH